MRSRKHVDASHIHPEIFFSQIYIDLRLFIGIKYPIGFNGPGDAQSRGFSSGLSEYGLDKEVISA